MEDHAVEILYEWDEEVFERSIQDGRMNPNLVSILGTNL